MPDEIFVLSVVAIVMSAVTIMVMAKIIAGYLRARHEAKRPASGGVTTSELEAVMRRAVEEGTRPLLVRIDDLEDRIAEQDRLPEPARRRLPEAP